MQTQNTNAFFPFNLITRDPATVLSLKSLFSNQTRYNEEGLDNMKLSEPFVETQMEVLQ